MISHIYITRGELNFFPALYISQIFIKIFFSLQQNLQFFHRQPDSHFFLGKNVLDFGLKLGIALIL